MKNVSEQPVRNTQKNTRLRETGNESPSYAFIYHSLFHKKYFVHAIGT